MQKNPTCLIDDMNKKNKEVFIGFGHAHISTQLPVLLPRKI